MKNKIIRYAAAVLCVLSLIGMTLSLTRKQESQAQFTPPPFEAVAQSGVPAVDESLGWSEIYQDGMGFKAYVCGNLTVSNDTADVYFTNSKDFDVWLKLRILDEKDEFLGETGLLKPGEYVKSVPLTTQVSEGQPIKLKIMAYEPDTYYSAGAVTLNTTISKGGA